MKLYCANCGKPLQHIRKALPKIGVIVDIVSYHECTEVPIPFDIANFPDAVKFVPIEGKEKFISSLNKLEPSKPFIAKFEPVEGKRPRMTGTDDLRDRRFDQEEKCTSAPNSVIDQIRSMGNSIPSYDLKDDTTDSEMEG